jgi:hypothetical protein
MSAKNELTIRQQVWLAAWTAAIQSAKYNPADEANVCLKAFEEKFGLEPEAAKK